MEMFNLAVKLKSLKLELGGDLIVHLLAIILKRTNDPSINLYLTLCKGMRGRTLTVLQKGRMSKRNKKRMRNLPANFVRNQDTRRNNVLSDDNKVAVDAIETFQLQLKTGFHLHLFKIFVVPSFGQNLISISNLDKFEFSYSFGKIKIITNHNDNAISNINGFLAQSFPIKDRKS
ncbi:hypothetical protein CR513_42337, partial [Mucuna pruriens]